MSEESYAVKRATPRTALVAAAEIVERQGGTRVNMRVSEISARGCYVDTLNPFEIGAQVDVRISHNGQTCEAPGKVIYSHAGFGMGIAFAELDAPQRAVLDGWLSELDALPH
jgi:hypothetical protein